MSEQPWSKARQPRGGGCSIPGCDNPDWSRRLCHKHYQKWHKYGDPTVDKRKYGCVGSDGYHRSQAGNKTTLTHRAIIETVIGKPMPPKAVTHHVNGDRADNRHNNLVVCPDRAYHNLIHARQRALEACGNANWRKCCRCGKWDDPNNISIAKAGAGRTQAYHKECNVKHVKRMKGKAR